MSSRSAVTATALTGADQAVLAGKGRYHGFTIRETAASTAVVRIYDGTSAAGTLLETIALTAGQSQQAYYEPEGNAGGIRVDAGIYVDVVSGAVEGSVRSST